MVSLLELNGEIRISVYNSLFRKCLLLAVLGGEHEILQQGAGEVSGVPWSPHRPSLSWAPLLQASQVSFIFWASAQPSGLADMHRLRSSLLTDPRM